MIDLTALMVILVLVAVFGVLAGVAIAPAVDGRARRAKRDKENSHV